jgi:hypothetical protein
MPIIVLQYLQTAQLVLVSTFQLGGIVDANRDRVDGAAVFDAAVDGHLKSSDCDAVMQ